MSEDKEPSNKSVAVAVIAIARFLASTNPTMCAHLNNTLDGAEKSGLSSPDLAFLRMIIHSLSA